MWGSGAPSSAAAETAEEPSTTAVAAPRQGSKSGKAPAQQQQQQQRPPVDSLPPLADEAAELAAGPEATIQNFAGRDMAVSVAAHPRDGFACSLSLVAKVELPPDVVFSLLTHPENRRVFKGIKAIRHRRVLTDDGHGKTLVEVEQVGQWKFACFRGTFPVRLYIETDRRHRTIKFRLARPGFMRDFAGSWAVQPFSQDALDDLVNRKPVSPLHRLQSQLVSLEGQLMGRRQESSLVRLEQSLAPALTPPPPLDRIMRSIAAKQVCSIMQDLREEADRINKKKKCTLPEAHPDLAALDSHVRKLP